LKFVVAIDGTASSGKSTTAKLLAKKLGFIHLDTGAMYRAVTYVLLKDGVPDADDELLSRLLPKTPLEFKIEDRSLAVYLNGNRLTDQLRTPEVDSWVSPVSEKPRIRSFLVAKQRELVKDSKLVCEGRDIGSVVFPDADLKVYMTCEISERARRRIKELAEKGITQGMDEVKAGLQERDRIDSTRKISPLVRTTDAVLVDTSKLSIDEQVALIEKEVVSRMRDKE